MAVTFPRESPILYSDHTSFKEDFTTLPTSDRYVSESFFNASLWILTPASITLQLVAYVIEPLPGKDKDFCILWGLAVRVTSAVLLCIILPCGLLCLIPGLPMFFYANSNRPYISVIDTSSRVPVALPKETLDVRSYNVGFVHEFMRIVGDLRSVAERANEIADAFLREQNSPDVICFQEGFNVEGVEILCNRLKEKYPYIIHSVAPHGTGFPSGKIIASKYRIEAVTFRILPHMIGLEKLAPRGLLGVRVDLGNGRYANIYNAHLQSLLGHERAQVRVLQLREVIRAMDEDHAADLARGDLRVKVGDFLMGDLNLSLVTAWGEENPCERGGAKIIADHFHIVQPSKGPTGSWYVGPFADRGILFRLKEWFEECWNGFAMGRQLVPLENPVLWGTSRWNSGPRTANTALYDCQLVRKRAGVPVPSGTCEIEHVPTNAQSAPSDHLPLRAVYELNRFANDGG